MRYAISRSRLRHTIAPLLAAALVLGAAGPAAPPDRPVSFISVDELKSLIDRRQRVDIIDVRHWDQYVRQHIKGARSMPIRAVPDRAHEITKTGLVVFY